MGNALPPAGPGTSGDLSVELLRSVDVGMHWIREAMVGRLRRDLIEEVAAGIAFGRASACPDATTLVDHGLP